MVLRRVGWSGLVCLSLALVFLLWPSTAVEAAQSPWPMAHGNPARSGLAPVNGPASGQLFWALEEVGAVGSSPVIGPDGTIYISSYSDDLLYAVSPEGMVLWSFDSSPYGGGCETLLFGAPAVGADGTIYLPFGVNEAGGGCPPYGVVAVNPGGSELWHWTAPPRIVPGVWFDSTPFDLLVGPDGNIHAPFLLTDCLEAMPKPLPGCRLDSMVDSGSVVALSPDGTLVWSRVSGYPPTQVALKGGRLYFGENLARFRFPPPQPVHYHLLAVDAASGAELWDLDLRNIGRVGDPAVGPDGTIYVSIGNDLYAFNPDGTEKWSLALEGQFVAAKPAIGPDGTLYVAYTSIAGDEYFLYAIQDAGTTGLVLWSIPLAGIGSSPVVDASGVIYVNTGDAGTLVAVNPNGTVKWEVDLGAPAYSPPAVQASFIYVGGSLYAIGSPPLLTAEKTALDLNGPPVWQGDIIEYTIVINNLGGPQGDNPGHEFEDPLPARTTYVDGSASASTGTIALEAGKIVWDGSIDPFGTVTLKFRVQVGPTPAPVGKLPFLWAGLGALMLAGFGLRGRRRALLILMILTLMVSLMLTLSSCVGPGITVCNQGVFHADTDNDGINETNILTDDPATAPFGDPTCL